MSVGASGGVVHVVTIAQGNRMRSCRTGRGQGKMGTDLAMRAVLIGAGGCRWVTGSLPWLRCVLCPGRPAGLHPPPTLMYGAQGEAAPAALCRSSLHARRTLQGAPWGAFGAGENSHLVGWRAAVLRCTSVVHRPTYALRCRAAPWTGPRSTVSSGLVSAPPRTAERWTPRPPGGL